MKSKHEKKLVISSPPQLQSCPSEVNAIVKNPPQVTEEIGTGKAATLEGILSAPPSPGPPPPPRPNLPSPSSRPHVYTSPTPITHATNTNMDMSMRKAKTISADRHYKMDNSKVLCTELKQN